MLTYIIKHKKYFAVLGGFLIHLSLGGFYTTGHIQQSIVKYMVNNSLSKDTLKSKDAVWLFGLMTFAQGSAISAGGILASRIGPSMTVLLGGWLMSLNVCFTVLTIKTYFFVVVLTYGFLAGIGTGLIYGVALGVPCKKFPNHKGLVLGIVLSGYGISPAIFDILQNYFTARNITYLPMSFIVLGLTYAILQFFGSVLFQESSKTKIVQYKENSIQASLQDSPEIFPIRFTPFSEELNLKPHQLLFEFDFWILWLTFLMNGSGIVLLISLYYNFGYYMKLTDNSYFGELTVVSVLASFLNFLGRIFWGILIDKKPYKILMIILSLSTAVLMGTLHLLSSIDDHVLKYYLYCLWIASLNFFQSGNFCLFPTMVAKLFGMNDFICNYGLLFTSCSIAATIVSITTVLAVSENNFSSQIYFNSFIVGCSLSIVAAALTLLFRGRSLMNSR